MKKLAFIICKIIMNLCVLNIFGSSIAAIIFAFKNPDMTAIRQLIEYTTPAIIVIISIIIYAIMYSIYENIKLKNSQESFKDTNKE